MIDQSSQSSESRDSSRSESDSHSDHLAPVRFCLIGGFLGAGKTTAILQLARRLSEQGRRVAIITNDQAEGLVDTQRVQQAGYPVSEIPDGCFCCRLNDLVATAGKLVEEHTPDVILAEPVGSCTDLVEAVIRPLNALYKDRFSVAPYAALLDPHRARDALTAGGRGGLFAKICYLFRMQQHEADVIVLNRVDELDTTQLHELLSLVSKQFPNAQLLTMSALTGDGVPELLQLLMVDKPGSRQIDVDYEAYTDAEQALAWFNAEYRLVASVPQNPQVLARRMLMTLRSWLSAGDTLVGHVKLTIRGGGLFVTGSLVHLDQPLRVTVGSPGLGGNCFDITLNARVVTDSDRLQYLCTAAMDAAIHDSQSQLITVAVKSFQPPAPVRPEGPEASPISEAL